MATLGQTGAPTSSDAGFNEPMDVAVDSKGTIYVSELSNHRVQVFNQDRVYVRTLGVTGESGGDHGHFNGLHHLVVDAQDRLYVVDAWNNRVQVYNPDGSYLTTIGGGWGTRTGQLRSPHGIAIASDGSVCLADWDNHRIQKFAPGVPGWRQVNINGFGARWPYRALGTASFNGALYLGSGWSSGGGPLYRYTEDQWTLVSSNGFGNPRNAGIETLREFQGKLYAGTTIWPVDDGPNGGQVWRSGNGTDWERVAETGFGHQTNDVINRLAVFNDRLYAGTLTYTSTVGSEIWRSPSGNPGTWEQVMANGFGDRTNYGIRALEVYGGFLYAGTLNYDADTNTSKGAEIWRTSDGSNWTQVAATQFDTSGNNYVDALTVFGGHLYAYSSAGQVRRCQVCAGSDWEQVIEASSMIPDSLGQGALEVFSGHLYAFMTNFRTGLVIFRTADGTQWEPYGLPGFGNSNNVGPYGDGSVVVHNGHLFVGAYNTASGLSVWVKTLTADFTATPTRGAPPMTVQFTNTSAGDFTSSQWDFGDGGTSTEANPAHTYTVPGTYAVTLTVGDGTETSTITKPGYVQVSKYIFLPLVMRNYGPVLYDDFNNPAYDGSYNSAKWKFDGENMEVFQVRQESGRMVFRSSASSTASSINMRMQSNKRSWAQIQVFEAKLAISSDRSAPWLGIRAYSNCDNVNGHGWGAACFLYGGADQSEPGFHCWIDSGSIEYTTDSPAGAYEAWNTVRIEADPTTAEIRFYLNGSLVGSHTPNDAAALLTAADCSAKIKLTNDPNSTATRYVDDVRITPAQ